MSTSSSFGKKDMLFWKHSATELKITQKEQQQQQRQQKENDWKKSRRIGTQHFGDEEEQYGMLAASTKTLHNEWAREKENKNKNVRDPDVFKLSLFLIRLFFLDVPLRASTFLLCFGFLFRCLVLIRKKEVKTVRAKTFWHLVCMCRFSGYYYIVIVLPGR